MWGIPLERTQRGGGAAVFGGKVCPAPVRMQERHCQGVTAGRTTLKKNPPSLVDLRLFFSCTRVRLEKTAACWTEFIEVNALHLIITLL